MKPFLLIFFVLFSCSCFAQSDTIQIVFDYLNSTQFRSACKDSILTLEKKYRQPSDTSFLRDDICFKPYKYCFRQTQFTDKSGRLRFNKLDTFRTGMYYMPAERCNSIIYLVFYAVFYASGQHGFRVIYYEYQNMLDSYIKLGEAHEFELAFADHGQLKFMSYRTIMID